MFSRKILPFFFFVSLVILSGLCWSSGKGFAQGTQRRVVRRGQARVVVRKGRRRRSRKSFLTKGQVDENQNASGQTNTANTNNAVNTASSPSPTPSPTPGPTPSPSPIPSASPCPKQEIETSKQTIKVSPNGIELAGFPFWVNMAVLIGAVIAFLLGVIAIPKAVKSKSTVLAVIIGIVCLSAFVFLGRAWDRLVSKSAVHQQIEKAKEESRREIPPSAPVAPSGFTASPISNSQVNLSWADNSDTEEGFKLERKLGPEGTYTQLVILGPNATSYADIGLSAETSVSYRIKAFNAYGESAYSNDAGATTLARSTPNENNWANPSTWLQYVILPIFLMTLLLLYPLVLIYLRHLRMREQLMMEKLRREHS